MYSHSAADVCALLNDVLMDQVACMLGCTRSSLNGTDHFSSSTTSVDSRKLIADLISYSGRIREGYRGWAG